MSATLKRDQLGQLVKANPKKALEKARSIDEPWFRAQALSSVARFTDGDPVAIGIEAAKVALKCDDDYKKSAVRAWEIAALAERGFATEARKSLRSALALAKTVTPASSRCDALLLLMQAAFKISSKEAGQAHEVLKACCASGDHWRCKRSLREAELLMLGECAPREFFW